MSWCSSGKSSGIGTLDLANFGASDGFQVLGDGSYDYAGFSVSGAGDMNGDGFADLIVGAFQGDDGGGDAGEAYVLFGRNFTGAVDVAGTAGADALTGDADANRILAGAGDDVIDGAAGDDVLLGGTGDDSLTGGADDDLFVFENGSGDDTVTDFVAGAGTAEDVIDLTAFLFDDFADVIASADDTGGTADVVITLDADDSVTLTGVRIADLDASDFAI